MIDCIDFQLAYPACNQADVIPWKIADGKCDEENDRMECGFDGGGKLRTLNLFTHKTYFICFKKASYFLEERDGEGGVAQNVISP